MQSKYKTSEAQRRAGKKYREANQAKISEARKEYQREYGRQRYLKIAPDRNTLLSQNEYRRNMRAENDPANILNLISLVV